MSNNLTPADSWMSPLYSKLEAVFASAVAKTVKQFAKSFFASTSDAELARFTDEEIFESVEDAWRFVQVRPGAATKIKFQQRLLDKDIKRRNETSIYVLLDDMPFVVDSISQRLMREGIIVRSIHNTVLHIRRQNKSGKSSSQLSSLNTKPAPGFKAEALCCINCAHIPREHFKTMEQAIRDTLKHVITAVKDYSPMCERAQEIQSSLRTSPHSPPVSAEELDESLHFIAWLLDNHFIFLGYEQYRIQHGLQAPVLVLESDSLLGVSRLKKDLWESVRLDSLAKGTAALILKPKVCVFAKSSSKSKVHNPTYYDYVLLKEFDAQGNVVIQHRFLGLYTSNVYFQSAAEIPLVRRKVEAVLTKSGFATGGHSIKDLLQVINVFPRDELFQITEKQLLDTAVEITRIQQTQTSRLFIRKDSYGKFYSCQVYIPRDMLNTRVRTQIQTFLEQELQAEETDYNIFVSASALVRLHFILHVEEVGRIRLNHEDLESRLVRLVKPWDEFFLDALRHEYLDNEANHLQRIYSEIYTEAYKETYFGVDGFRDISRIEDVVGSGRLGLYLSDCSKSEQVRYSFKIFSHAEQLTLSKVTPILENLGLGIISEKAFPLQSRSGEAVWLHDYSLFIEAGGNPSATDLSQNFEEAFRAIWEQLVDNDRFNALVVSAGLHWRDAALLRAYAAYLKQIKFGYSTLFIAETLARHHTICGQLVAYFHALHDPRHSDEPPQQSRRLGIKLLAAIDKVANLSEDAVLRAFLNLIVATQRTNYFQQDAGGKAKEYFAFKLFPELVKGMPMPRPHYEIFVYSRATEGVHLRSGNVARGGLRWSDRAEDYRTEILGLVKAQQVKNAVIVPVGAKGGFVVKDQGSDPQHLRSQAVACYKIFIKGLLDVTDNQVDGKLIPPQDVVRLDGDDPYLVVAADKGTASFSDIANGVAADYQFWLRDGFASGGSNGYDHKLMGITARGAWISVQRHFRELGINTQKQGFTVIGIGDMSGDVFGNGMLLSRHICLIAAFNHKHIFIDPDPYPKTGYRERLRLFKKPGSNWSDYNPKLISRGGGVFSRQEKAIAITSQMKIRFDIEQSSLTPDELIRHLMCSEVDLIWNGGIGTYVKASAETHAEVGDRSNDAVRINGSELRCRVIGEGGNLGLTQSARVEYGLGGGLSITDFVDNSGGVDCSDHEVNIKILLNELEYNGRLSQRTRNTLLESMQDDVAELVLKNNYAQVQAIGLAQAQAALRHREYGDLTSYLETHAGLDRILEYLPERDEFEERRGRRRYLTRPEIAVLTSYMKMHLKTTLVSADFLDQKFFLNYLYQAFPDKLVRRFRTDIIKHPLRREIIATQLANEVVNMLGPSFVYRMVDSTASSVSNVVKAAVTTMAVCGVREPWNAIEELDYKIGSDIQYDMMARLLRLVRRVTRWLLVNRRTGLNCETEIRFLSPARVRFQKLLPDKLPIAFKHSYQEYISRLRKNGVPLELADWISKAEFLFPACSLAEISHNMDKGLANVTNIYFTLGEELGLNWLGGVISNLPVSSYWQALARETYLDDLTRQHHVLTCNAVAMGSRSSAAAAVVKGWSNIFRPQINRIKSLMRQLQSEQSPDYPMVSVVLGELATLAQSSGKKAEGSVA
ncbi:MAG: NAD-glutamate dehydrogenase [Gammaproteobacteria bacterium]|nr:NAD-glutamate dehydrogenase [Gammaproteobacteria bacterium]